MRLIHIEDSHTKDEHLQLTLCDFIGGENERPRYGILSHRWREEEVLFTDMSSERSDTQAKRGYHKLEACCDIAFRYGLRYLWCDTCCIDKSSSAELSEAINSMYEYYARADLCIAYLDDIEDDAHSDSYLNRATWFTRGWTLQELIAPAHIEFFSQGWKPLGTKATLSRQISVACGISVKVLTGTSLEGTYVSEKMSWAARRITTRPEDQAYSLMGLFSVHMPPLYGEGAESAFRRLQLEILHTTTDHTLFAWDSDTATGDMLAPSVSCFKRGGDYTSVGYEDDLKTWSFTELSREVKPDFSMTNAGLHIQLPMIPVTARQVMDLEQHTSLFTDLHFAFLACKPRGRTALVAVCLQKASRVAFPKYWRVAFDRQTLLEIKRPMHERHSIGITSFVPIWISRAPVTVDIHSKTRLPNSVETVSFELWFKDLSALGGLFSGSEMKQSKQVVAKEAYERLESLGDEVPLEFSLSERRLKHYLSSTISARGSEHDVITFHGWTKEGYGVAPGFAGIAFGVVNGYLWMELPVAHPDTMHKTLFQDYSFPVGNTWRYSGPQISVYTESRGDFEFKATARNPRYFGKFVRSNEVLTSSSESLDSLIENLTTHYLRLYVWRAQTFTGLGGIIVR